jgi:hypothetical protein
MAGIVFSSLHGWGSFAVPGDVNPQNMLACSNPASDAEPGSIQPISGPVRLRNYSLPTTVSALKHVARGVEPCGLP